MTFKPLVFPFVKWKERWLSLFSRIIGIRLDHRYKALGPQRGLVNVSFPLVPTPKDQGRAGHGASHSPILLSPPPTGLGGR